MRKLPFSLLLFLIGLTELAAAQLVNRRVLIIDFANLQKNPNFEYLQISIPEAMLVALTDTKNFDLLPVSNWAKMVKKGTYDIADAKSDDSAKAAALSQGADIVVMGSFVSIGQDLKITARALEATSGRLIVTKSVRSKTDGSMFTSIDNLALEMAAEMKEKLPPLPPREIIREKLVRFKEQQLKTQTLLRFGAGKSLPKSSYYQPGFNQLALDLYSPWPSLPLGSLLYAKLGYRLLPAHTITSTTATGTTFDASIMSAGVGLAYPYRLANRWFITVGLGARYSLYKETSTVQANKAASTGQTVGGQASLSIEYALFTRMGLFTEVAYSYEPIGKATVINIGGLGAIAGVTYRQ